MCECLTVYIEGLCMEQGGDRILDVENAATEEARGRIARGGAIDFDRAVVAARRAPDGCSLSLRLRPRMGDDAFRDQSDARLRGGHHRLGNQARHGVCQHDHS